VQFDSALVRFLHGEMQRVVERLRGFAHLPGEIFRPRLQRGLIKSIASGSDLKQQRIEVKALRDFKYPEQFGFLLLGRQIAAGRPVDVAHAGDPCAAKLPLRRGRLDCGRRPCADDADAAAIDAQ
jgi:hypothetical protein